MRRRALLMMLRAVAVALLLLAVPLSILVVTYFSDTGQGDNVLLIVLAEMGVGLACLVVIVVAVMLALRESRKVEAPLIYLAAQAEQVGSGQVQARMRPSGIEEIDLVSEELQRATRRLAGRLAAERQLAADASHQLRTPLTALSMHIEEITFLTADEQIRDEAEAALTQVSRMLATMEDLKGGSRRSSGGTPIQLDELFSQLEKEWGELFEAQGRQLIFMNDVDDRLPVVTAGSLNQALSTLIENSLRYGAGTVLVETRTGSTSRSVFIDVSDEGEGVSDDIAPRVFERGVSGHGSTGIGLALAKTLVEADNGRLELTRRRPPVFTISLAALPDDYAPEKVVPRGAMVSIGRRSRRL